jgi:hypothetical protein
MFAYILKKEDLDDKGEKPCRYNEFAELLMLSCGGFFPLDEASDGCLRDMFSRILQVVSPITLAVQEQYVDRVYRDSYYIHYAAKHLEHSRYCSRVFIFEGKLNGPALDWKNKDLKEIFVGCFVARPTKYGIIGRTLINPRYLFDKENSKDMYVLKTRYKVSFNGEFLEVSAFPYMMQDNETITCAETTIINLLDYYSNQYADYRYCLPSDIHNVRRTHGFERTLPSRGMPYEYVSKTLYDFGFYPRLYATPTQKENEQKPILHYYIESGIPVAVCVRPGADRNTESSFHSFACIGHGKRNIKRMLRTPCSKGSFCIVNTADAYDNYIVQDDNKSPYKIRSFECGDKLFGDKDKIEYLAVPLYKGMFAEIQDVFAVCKSIMLSDEFNTLYKTLYKVLCKKKEISCEEIGTNENPLIFRLFIAPTGSFLNWRIPKFSDAQTRLVYLSTPFPKFVCVCELYDKQSYQSNEAIGELIIDSTSSTNQQFMNTILVNFPGAILAHDRNMEFPKTAINKNVKFTDPGIKMLELKNWEVFESYTGNLTLI